MKRSSQILKRTGYVLSILLFSIAISCESQSSIAPTVEKSPKITTDNGLKLLHISDGTSKFQKITTAEKWMNIEDGGWLRLFHLGEDTLDLMFVYTHLIVAPNTLSDSANISLTVDDENFAGNVDVTFEPHGITFSSPALLTLYAYGINLEGVDVDSLKFYYDNTETGVWEEMAYEDLYVNEATGTVYVLNAELPHFSRYAIGTE